MLAIGETEDGAGCRSADSRQRLQRVEVLRQRPLVLIAHANGGLVQVACARIVTEPLPVLQHLVDAGVGQRAQVGKALQEILVIGYYRADLGLLQHDFRQPYAVGVLLLPGQVATAVAMKPVKHRSREAGRISVHSVEQFFQLFQGFLFRARLFDFELLF